MPPWLSVTILVVLGLALLAGMAKGWRRLQRGPAEVPAPPAVPDDADLGAARSEAFDATYVSSTRAGDWLDRVGAHGLGVRSVATVQVHDAGVVVRRRGAPDVFVPRASLRAVGTSGGMAGKVVGGEGLVVLTWAPDAGRDPRGLDTGLRLRHPRQGDELRAAVQTLIGSTPATRGHEENS
ncbi:PH-like domain-containing protein [Cellulomonas sp. Marseille-Q8402]